MRRVESGKLARGEERADEASAAHDRLQVEADKGIGSEVAQTHTQTRAEDGGAGGGGVCDEGSDGSDGDDAGDEHNHKKGRARGKLLWTLGQLLLIRGTEVRSALDQASQLAAEALGADKVDSFLHDPATGTLIALGTSNTPMSKREKEIGMDRLPVANGGRSVAVHRTGTPFLTGHADQDPHVQLGFTQGLGIRSMIAVPLEADGERRGVLEAVSAQPDAFGQDDLSFLQIVAWWVAVVTQRNEFVEQTMQGAVERTKTMAGDELVMVLAHDIRNYMTPIKGRMELVRRRASSDGRTRDIEDIDAAQSALHRRDGLVEDLLDSARLEQGLFSLAIRGRMSEAVTRGKVY